MPKTHPKISLIKSHFSSVDPVIHAELQRMNLELLSSLPGTDNYFRKLCQDIIGQQLAGAAADAIIGRFVDLLPRNEVTPAGVMELADIDIRNIGASWAKVRYIKDLALQVSQGTVRLDRLIDLPDDQIITELTRVKGIGPWTAEMFLIFTLGREDVFSYGDLGLKNGFKKLYGVTDRHLQSKLKKIVPRWSPFRSYASLALWHAKDSK